MKQVYATNVMAISYAAARPAVSNMIRKADLPFDKETILARLEEKAALNKF